MSLRLRIVNIVGTICAVLTFLLFLLFTLEMLEPDPVQCESSTYPLQDCLPDVENRFVIPIWIFYVHAIVRGANHLETWMVTWTLLIGSCVFWILLLIRRVTR